MHEVSIYFIILVFIYIYIYYIYIPIFPWLLYLYSDFSLFIITRLWILEINYLFWKWKLVMYAQLLIQPPILFFKIKKIFIGDKITWRKIKHYIWPCNLDRRLQRSYSHDGKRYKINNLKCFMDPKGICWALKIFTKIDKYWDLKWK